MDIFWKVSRVILSNFTAFYADPCKNPQTNSVLLPFLWLTTSWSIDYQLLMAVIFCRYMRSSSASSEVIPVPQPRQRVNSTSSYHGRDSRGPSPTPVAPAEMARSYQSRYGAHAPSQTNHHSNAHQLAPLYPGSQHPLRHGGSQENLAESTMSLARYPPEPSPVRMAHRGHNNVDSQRPGVPRTNPHVRHHRPGDFHRSVSEDPRHMAPSERYHVYEGDDSRSLCGDIPYDVTRTGYEYAPHNGRRRPAPALMDPSRSSFVTDL